MPTTPENILNNSKKYYEKNAERMRENSRKYYEKNRDKIISRIKSSPTYNNYPSKYIV